MDDYQLSDILLAINMCKKYIVDIKSPPEIDGDLDTTISTIEVKMLLYQLEKIKQKNNIICKTCGDTGRVYPTLDEPDGIICPNCK